MNVQGHEWICRLYIKSPEKDANFNRPSEEVERIEEICGEIMSTLLDAYKGIDPSVSVDLGNGIIDIAFMGVHSQDLDILWEVDYLLREAGVIFDEPT